MLTERQKKLELIVNEIDDLYGCGNGYVYEETDVDEFIKELKEELKKIRMGDILYDLSENINKSYMELLNEI